MTQGQGASSALPIYAYFMQKVQADVSLGLVAPALDAPSGEQTIVGDCGTPSITDFSDADELEGYGK
jgi:penicillin-binding protein 1A